MTVPLFQMTGDRAFPILTKKKGEIENSKALDLCLEVGKKQRCKIFTQVAMQVNSALLWTGQSITTKILLFTFLPSIFGLHILLKSIVFYSSVFSTSLCFFCFLFFFHSRQVSMPVSLPSTLSLSRMPYKTQLVRSTLFVYKHGPRLSSPLIG